MGAYTVRWEAVDDCASCCEAGESGETSFVELGLTIKPFNNPPEWSSSPSSVSVQVEASGVVGIPLTSDADAADEEGAVELVDCAGNLFTLVSALLDLAPRTLTFSPALNSQVAHYCLQLRVSDVPLTYTSFPLASKTTYSAQFTLTVTPFNHPPVLKTSGLDAFQMFNYQSLSLSLPALVTDQDYFDLIRTLSHRQRGFLSLSSLSLPQLFPIPAPPFSSSLQASLLTLGDYKVCVKATDSDSVS